MDEARRVGRKERSLDGVDEQAGLGKRQVQAACYRGQRVAKIFLLVTQQSARQLNILALRDGLVERKRASS